MLTPSDIEDRMEDAARTLRRLPDPPGSGPKGYGSSWPDYVRSRFTAYGADEARIKVVPSAADIQQMEECLIWLSWLSPDDAKIVWLRAEGYRWKQIGHQVGVVRQTAWRRWSAALITISKRLQKQRRKGASKGHAKSEAATGGTKRGEADGKTLL